ncbi:MAG TPA: cytochrome c biogenesis protein/redoxin, partial [Pyrinomonadaceae bacterium]|nr:cytochrome c biogenesis protein/redoxin [Pyrinomonadaceae bacterium]
AGISLIFLILGATAGFVGSALTNNVWIRVIGGLIIIAFGLQLIGVIKIGALYKDTRQFSNNNPTGVFGSFTLGLAFAAGWTPCIGPILGGIIGLAATSGGWQSGLILSAFYSLGLALPFLLVGIFINQFLSFSKGFKKHLHTVEVISGVLLVAIGLLVASGYVTVLNQSGLANVLPNPESYLQLDEKKPETSQNEQNGGKPAKEFPLAPDVQFETLDGKTVNLGEMRGKVVLLNFWATWCVPCRSEIPALGALQKDFGSQGLSVVGVSFEDTASQVKSFQKDLPMDYTVLTSGQQPPEQLAYVGLPTTFLIDRQGRIRQKIVGEKKREFFEAAVKPLLDEK